MTTTSLLPYLLLGLSLTACRTDKDLLQDYENQDEVIDVDGDGVEETEDCDDQDASVYPDAEELCDEIDNDCDGEIDEGVTGSFYADSDEDGYGDPGSEVEACERPSGYVEDNSDCEDDDPDSHPGASERCDDVDNDCDGETDEELVNTWYWDADGDGFGDGDSAVDRCDPVSGYVADDTDCNDLSDAAYPGADEVCDEIDNDCDGEVDEDEALDVETWYADADGDGHGDPDRATWSCTQPSGYVSDSTDCDDSVAAVSPVATELCDEVDNDCDGEIDEDDAADGSTWYVDSDGDGYGDAASTTEACSQPSGTVADDTDCDDSSSEIHPAADEVCDEVDNDCDGDVDDDDSSLSDGTTWYVDIDGDGYGSDSLSTVSCEASTSFVSSSDDCDDGNSAINPDADEVCDGEDNDCDSEVDEDDATDTTAWYSDSDGDGYGDSSSSTEACDAPSGTVSDDTDCDDEDDTVHPSADELCDGLDNDCDGILDPDSEVLGGSEACPAVDCQDVQDTLSSATDGNYWIDPTGSGSPFEIFCDLNTEGGGWTLVANIDDINDPWLIAQDETWETTELRNETSLPSYSTDITVTAKYQSWTTIDVTDVYVYYKNDGASFLCEGLDLVDTLDEIFATTPDSDECVSQCTTWTDNRLDDEVESPVGLNCSDGNEGWMSTSYNTAENARIGGRSVVNSCCVVNAYAGAAGDRGFDTSNLNKTWGAYDDGESEDNHILIFVR